MIQDFDLQGKDTLRTFKALVQKAGGEVLLTDGDLIYAPLLDLFIDQRPNTGDIRLATKLPRADRVIWSLRYFGDTLAQAQDLLRQAATETEERASDLRSQVEAKLLSAKLKVQDLQADAVVGAKAATRATDNYVRDNPWVAIGALAAVGLLAGVLIGRR
jgi:ElaB/YqjD/DUF883 family membrane-anchored ribosome-binding protein